MANPIVVLNPPTFKGSRVDFSGTVNFQGGSGTVAFYLDPLPAGAPLGPFALTLTGQNFSQVGLRLGAGRWRVRVVATSTLAEVTTTNSSALAMNRVTGRTVMPLPGGANTTSPLPTAGGLDPDTKLAYSAAIAGASAGSKRLAGANAIVAAMGTKQLLQIFRNNVEIIRAEYVGAMTTSSTSGIQVLTSTVSVGSVVATGDLTTGNWHFVLQGGLNYSREIRGSVGPLTSGKALILNASPVLGNGFLSPIALTVPAAIDP